MSEGRTSLGFKLITMSVAIAAVAAAGVGTFLIKHSEDEIKDRLLETVTAMARTVVDLCAECSIDSLRMRDALLAAKLEASGSVWVMNVDGSILTTPDPRNTVAAARDFGDHPIELTSVRQPIASIGEKVVGARIPLKQVLGMYEAGVGLLDVGGETRVVAFRSLPDKGWVVGVDEPLDSPSSPGKSIRKFILLSCGVLALCIVLSTALFSSLLIKPYYRQQIELSQQIAAANNSLRKLYELSVGMQKPLALGQRMHDVLGSAREVVGVDRLFVFMPDKAGKMLECRGAVGNEDEPPERITVPVGEAGGAVGRAFSNGETFKITQGFVPEHLRLGPPYSEIRALRSREFVALPLIVEDEIVGVVTADNQLSKRPIKEQEIELLGLFVTQAAVAIKNANMYERLKEHAADMEVTDYLTKTYNHPYFLKLANRALVQLRGQGRPLTVAALSVNNLAEFNRLNGHNRGDKVLTRIVGTIKSHCDREMVLGRCFGSTFGILFPGHDEAQAAAVMSRIAGDLSAHGYRGEEKLEQKKMRFTWQAAQYDESVDQTLDDFVSAVLLRTRPDMT